MTKMRLTTRFTQITKRVAKLLARIPERHYWPIFVILSLYFIVPMSEITVTLGAILYFKYENKVRPVIARLTNKLPSWLTYGGSILFFLVMIDDTVFYFALIAMAFWCSRQLPKHKDHATIDKSATDP